MGISDWPEGDGPCGPFMNCVVMGLVHLHVLSKLEALVIVVVYSEACDYLAQAEPPTPQGWRRWESVEPEADKGNYIADHSVWHFIEGCSVLD